MYITPELVAEAKKVFPADGFIESQEVIAQHILFKQFANHYPNWPKLIFYIVCDEIFGFARDKDVSGNLGRKLLFDINKVPGNLKPKM